MAQVWVSYNGSDATGTGTSGNPYRTLRWALGHGVGAPTIPAYGSTIWVVPHPGNDISAYYEAVAPSSASLGVVFKPAATPAGTPSATNMLWIKSADSRQKVILNCDRYSPATTEESGCFGSVDVPYIGWDGIKPAPSRRLGVKFIGTADHCALYNTVIDLGAREDDGGGTGNYWGLRLEGASGDFLDGFDGYNISVQNSLSSTGLNTDAQCCAFGQFRARNITLRNFDFFNCGTGIDDKEGGQNNTYRNGYLRRIGRNGVLINQLGLDQGDILNLTFSQLLLVGASEAAGQGSAGFKINLGASDETFDGVTIKNCTIYNFPKGISGPSGVACAMTGIEFYNNIVVCCDGSGDQWQVWDSTRPTDLLSDYNTYRALSGMSERFGGGTGNTNVTLATWQGLASSTCDGGTLDPQANTTDPAFQGSTFTDTDPATNWRLGVGNALRTNGSVGGLAAGADTARGCYVNDSDVIGLDGSSNGVEWIVLGVKA